MGNCSCKDDGEYDVMYFLFVHELKMEIWITCVIHLFKCLVPSGCCNDQVGY